MVGVGVAILLAIGITIAPSEAYAASEHGPFSPSPSADVRKMFKGMSPNEVSQSLDRALAEASVVLKRNGYSPTLISKPTTASSPFTDGSAWEGQMKDGPDKPTLPDTTTREQKPAPDQAPSPERAEQPTEAPDNRLPIVVGILILVAVGAYFALRRRG